MCTSHSRNFLSSEITVGKAEENEEEEDAEEGEEIEEAEEGEKNDTEIEEERGGDDDDDVFSSGSAGNVSLFGVFHVDGLLAGERRRLRAD